MALGLVALKLFLGARLLLQRRGDHSLVEDMETLMAAALLHVDGVRHVLARLVLVHKALALFGDDDRVVHSAGEVHALLDERGRGGVAEVHDRMRQ